MHCLDNSANPPKRQFTLRALFCFVLLVSVLCGVIASVDRSTTAGLLTFAVAARILAIVVVGTIVGLIAGSISKSLVASLLGVVIADVVWRGFFPAIGASSDAQDLVFNPLVVIGLVACSPAAAKSRTRALTIGVSLSLILPVVFVVVAYGMLLNKPVRPGEGGAGLAEAVIILVSVAAVFTGIIGTLITRFLFEAVQWLTKTTTFVRSEAEQ